MRIVIISFVLVAILLVGFQYWQYKNIGDMSCGGDFSYNTQCPLGTFCKSLNQGSGAGGICATYLFLKQK